MSNQLTHRKTAIWILMGTWLLCAALLWLRDRGIDGPFVFADEGVYFNLAKQIHVHHNYAGHTQYNPLYPLILSVLFALPSLSLTYDVIRIVNPILWASALIPLFLICRRFLGSGWFTWLTALGSIAMPLSAASPIVWAEPLFYPLWAWSVYFAVRCFDSDKVTWAIGAGIFAGLTFLTKQGAVVVTIAIGITLVFRFIIAGRSSRRLAAVAAFGSAFGIVVAPWLFRNILTPNAGLIGYSGVLHTIASQFSFRFVDALACTTAYAVFSLCFVGAAYFVLALPLFRTGDKTVQSFVLLVALMFLGELGVTSLASLAWPFQEVQPIYFTLGRYMAMVFPYVLIAAGLAAIQTRDVLRSDLRKLVFVYLACCLLMYSYSPLKAVTARASIDAPDLSVLSYVFYGGGVLWGDTARVIPFSQRLVLAVIGPAIVVLSLLLKKPTHRVSLAIIFAILSGFASSQYLQSIASATIASNKMGRYLAKNNIQTRDMAFDPDLFLPGSPISFWQDGIALGTAPVNLSAASEVRSQACFDFGIRNSPVADGCSPVQVSWIRSALYNDRQGYGFEPDHIDSLLGHFQTQIGIATGLEDFVYGPTDTKFSVRVPKGSYRVGVWVTVTDRQFTVPVDFALKIDGQLRSVKKTHTELNEFLDFDRVQSESGMIVISLIPAAQASWLINKLVVVADRKAITEPNAKYYLTPATLSLTPAVTSGNLNLYPMAALSSTAFQLAPIKAISDVVQDNRLAQFSQGLSSATSSLRLRQGEPMEVSVNIRNSSSETWYPNGKYPIDLGFVWLSGEKLVKEGDRTPLTRAIAPGETATVNVALNALTTAGNFDLRFSMVQEGVTWFSTAGSKPLDIGVSIN